MIISDSIKIHACNDDGVNATIYADTQCSVLGFNFLFIEGPNCTNISIPRPNKTIDGFYWLKCHDP